MSSWRHLNCCTDISLMEMYRLGKKFALRIVCCLGPLNKKKVLCSAKHASFLFYLKFNCMKLLFYPPCFPEADNSIYHIKTQSFWFTYSYLNYFLIEKGTRLWRVIACSMLEKFVENYVQWEGPHAGAGEGPVSLSSGRSNV